MAVKLKQPKKKESLKKTKNSPKSITNSPIENIEIVPRQAVDEIISSDTREKYMSLGDHLEELRQRLIHCIFIVAIFTIGFLIFGSEVHVIFASSYKKFILKLLFCSQFFLVFHCFYISCGDLLLQQ